MNATLKTRLDRMLSNGGPGSGRHPYGHLESVARLASDAAGLASDETVDHERDHYAPTYHLDARDAHLAAKAAHLEAADAAPDNISAALHIAGASGHDRRAGEHRAAANLHAWRTETHPNADWKADIRKNDLENSGTSDGVRRSWETRRGYTSDGEDIHEGMGVRAAQPYGGKKGVVKSWNQDKTFIVVKHGDGTSSSYHHTDLALDDGDDVENAAQAQPDATLANTWSDAARAAALEARRTTGYHEAYNTAQDASRAAHKAVPGPGLRDAHIRAQAAHESARMEAEAEGDKASANYHAVMRDSHGVKAHIYGSNPMNNSSEPGSKTDFGLAMFKLNNGGPGSGPRPGNAGLIQRRQLPGTMAGTYDQFVEGAKLQSQEPLKVEARQHPYFGSGIAPNVMVTLPKGTVYHQIPGGLMATQPDGKKFLVRQYPDVLQKVASIGKLVNSNTFKTDMFSNRRTRAEDAEDRFAKSDKLANDGDGASGQAAGSSVPASGPAVSGRLASLSSSPMLKRFSVGAKMKREKDADDLKNALRCEALKNNGYLPKSKHPTKKEIELARGTLPNCESVKLKNGAKQTATVPVGISKGKRVEFVLNERMDFKKNKNGKKVRAWVAPKAAEEDEFLN